MFKRDEVVDMIKRIEEIESNFWLKYKFYNQENRKYLELQFQNLYKELEKHLDTVGIQEEMEIKND